MRSCLLIVAHPGRRPAIRHTGGLAARCTETDTVHLVAAAATPLGGDAITVRVQVHPGARLRLRSAAATIALPGPLSACSNALWELQVDGDLDLDLEPTVVAGGARHHTDTRVRIGPDAQLRIRERAQIGRSYERCGQWSAAVHADVVTLASAQDPAAPTVPLLRHRIELGAATAGDDVIDSPRACIGELHYPGPADGAAGTRLALAAGGGLATWLGHRLPADAG